ncbi:MAG: glutamine synthetase [Lachnospiraceae bacterium]|nr:glutamine synthetase [Candidatus Merdinaster equi]
MRTKDDILEQIEAEGVEFIRLQFTDVLGILKNVAVTPSQFERIMAGRFAFEGDTLFNDLGVYDGYLYLKPVMDSFVILPWRPQTGKVAKMICDITYEDGTPFEMSSRRVLEKVVSEIAEEGYMAVADPQCEFFLFHTDENGNPTTITHEKAGYMDVGPTDFGENTRRDIVLNLEQMGFTVKSSHHEKAPGQHEVDFIGGETLSTADDIASFRFAVRSIAKRFGLYATFMPMPLQGKPGSGMHLDFTLYKEGKNVFASEGDNISEEALAFMAGVIKHEKAICAFANPTVNSYKRLLTGDDAPRFTDWDTKGEKSSIKFHARNEFSRVEIRFPDSSANPYLTLALCLKAGIEGIRKSMKPGKPGSKNAGKLPENLKEAMDAAKSDKLVKDTLGGEFLDIYLMQKSSEWDRYMKQVSDWEIETYLVKI